MKKISTLLACLGLAFGTMAQQDDQQPNDDQLQQQAPRETNAEVERAALRDARRQEAEKREQNAQPVTVPESRKEKAKPKPKDSRKG